MAQQAIDASQAPPTRPARPYTQWFPAFSKVVVCTAIAISQAQRLWQSRTDKADRKRRVEDTAKEVAAQAPALLDCARWITNAESVEGADTNALFTAADANGDGRVDLLELMRAVYKWAPLATTRDDSLAAARDAALDFFLLLGADPIRGLDRAQFSNFLQAWCLQGGWGLKAISDDFIRLLCAPDHLRRAEDKETAEGIEASAATPAAVQEWMERRRPDLLFNLWASGGGAGRAPLCDAPTWLLSHVSEESIRARGGSAAAARRFLAAERRRPGSPDMARPDFAFLAQRFAELAGQSKREVSDYLMTLAVNGTVGGQPPTGTVLRKDMMNQLQPE